MHVESVSRRYMKGLTGLGSASKAMQSVVADMNSFRKATELAGLGSVSKAMQSAVADMSSFRKATELAGLGSVSKAMQSVVADMNSFRKATELAGLGSASKAMQSAVADMSSFRKATELAGLGSASKAMQSAVADMSSFRKATELAGLGPVSKAMQSAVADMSSFRKATELAGLGSVSKAMQSAVADMSSFRKATEQAVEWAGLRSTHKVLQSMAGSASFASTIESLNRSNAFYKSIAQLAQPSVASVAVEAMSGILAEEQRNSIHQIIGRNDRLEKNELNTNLTRMSESGDSTTYVESFKKLPTIVQFLIMYIFLELITPIITSTTANLITPHVSEYFDNLEGTRSEKIGKLKRFRLEEYVEDLSGIRFITGENVRLREEPSTKAEILDELTLGQVVVVLSKKRNWIEVKYEYEDGEALNGWVFTRYTTRFRH